MPDNDLNFAPETDASLETATGLPHEQAWKILVVDDEQDIIEVTKIALKKVTFKNRSLNILSANSAQQAKRMLELHSDIALVILDVVMEEEDSGLKLVRYARNILGNSTLRIILRTGQPGQAPERNIILEYDINDYKEKSELTAQKLFTTVIASLRTYHNIITIMETQNRLSDLIENLEVKIEGRTKAIKTILDNVNEGFLICNNQAIVQEGYSVSCLAIFGQKTLEQSNFLELLSLNPIRLEHFQCMYEQIFDEALPPFIGLDQLPTQFNLGKQVYQLHGSFIKALTRSASTVLFTITDITAQITAQNESRKNQNLLHILSNLEAFQHFIDDAKLQLEKIAEDIATTNFDHAKMGLHTLKGNASCYFLYDIVNFIHDLEEQNTIEASAVEVLTTMIKAFLEQNKELLKTEYHSPTTAPITFTPDTLKHFQLTCHQSADQSSLKQSVDTFIQEAFHQDVLSLLGTLPIFVTQYSERILKPARLTIRGSDLRMDPQKARPVFNLLPHLVKNALDHGIEDSHERATKPVLATLLLQFYQTPNAWEIIFSDDGAGIDPDYITQKALQKNLINANDALRLTRDEKINLIFLPEFSTQETVTVSSGRGIGLSAVRDTIHKLGGKITIESQPRLGTTFKIFVPT